LPQPPLNLLRSELNPLQLLHFPMKLQTTPKPLLYFPMKLKTSPKQLLQNLQE
jgi:hypothetical protein